MISRNKPTNYLVIFVILIVLLVLAVILELSLGSVYIPPLDIIRLLTGGEIKDSWTKIIFLFRFPRAITAVLAGAALAVSGLQMQTIFRNPLAGPSVLGINSGASLGVAVVVLLAGNSGNTATLLAGMGLFGNFGIIISASCGAAFVLFLVLLVSRRVENVMTLLILGLLFGYAASAFVSILMHFSIAERIHTYTVWTFGSFNSIGWKELKMFVPVVVSGLIISGIIIKQLNALLLGEKYARSMGLNVKRIRIIVIIITAVLAGSVTAFCGPVAFIGVAIPHLARSIFGTSDHRLLIPGSALTGAVIALFSDLISHVPGSQIILPLNAVTSIIGAPVIAWVILRKKNIHETIG